MYRPSFRFNGTLYTGIVHPGDIILLIHPRIVLEGDTIALDTGPIQVRSEIKKKPSCK